MSEVSKFLIEEYDNTNHKINEINYSIRGLDIDIDSIDNYLKKIRQKESEPESLFESKKEYKTSTLSRVCKISIKN